MGDLGLDVVSLWDRAAVIPGRSLTRSKKLFGLHGVSADGAMITATDGCVYLDTVCGLGAVSLGYGASVPNARGVCSLPWDVEVLAAEAVLEHVAPWASHVRFVKTGSEATQAAYVVALASTGRQLAWLREGAYHGWHAWSQSASSRLPSGVLPALGGEDLKPAAVFVEPDRWKKLDVEWLRDVRGWTRAIGALLVFDEMITGGRIALGGITEATGVIPDLACYGKAFGNGTSVAFVVGRDALRDHGELVSGTFSGEASGLQACVDVIQAYRTEPVLDTMWARGRQLWDGLQQAIPASLGRVECAAPVQQRIVWRNPDRKQAFTDAMKAQGILWHPEVALTMAAHTPEHIDRVVNTAGEICRAWVN